MSRRRVLVADESITIQKLVHLGLATSSFEVVAASDGQDALQKIKTLKPDLVLADTGLRQIDGFQLIERIRTDSSLTNIKTILLKGVIPKGKEGRLKEVLVDDILTKPFDARSLSNMVHKVLFDEDSTAVGLESSDDSDEKTPIVKMAQVSKKAKIEPFKRLEAIAAEVQGENGHDADHKSLADEDTAKILPAKFKNPVKAEAPVEAESTVAAHPKMEAISKVEIESIMRTEIQNWIQGDLKALAERLLKEEISKIIKDR